MLTGMATLAALVIATSLLASGSAPRCSHPVARPFIPESFVSFGSGPITCTAVETDFGDGVESLVVGYSNGVAGAVRVLRRVDGSWRLGGSFEGNLAGSAPEIEVLDLTGDDRPEIVAAFRSDKWNYPTWIFAWTGKAIVSLTPTSELGLTDLLEPGFADIDDDGVAEVLQRDIDGERVYHLREGRYRICEGEVALADLFFPRDGRPYAIAGDELAVTAPDARWALVVINGERSGTKRARSVRISRDGQPLVELDGETRYRQVPVALRQASRLDVEVRGEPESQIWVVVVNAAVKCESRRPPFP